MNFNNFEYPERDRIGFIYNYIQTVMPFQIDTSLDIYNLLRKLIDYANELGERNNTLIDTTKNLVDFLNKKLEDQRKFITDYINALNQEWGKFKDTVDKQYEEFVEEINNKLQEYETQIEASLNTNLTAIRTHNENEYNNLKTTLDNLVVNLNKTVDDIEPTINQDITSFENQINTLVSTYHAEFTDYQNTITNDLNSFQNQNQSDLQNFENTIQDEINDIPSQIESAKTDVNLVPAINTALDNYDLSEIFNNIYGTIINIFSMETGELTPVISETPVYNYNPETNVLTNLVNMEVVPINENSIYLYNGKVFTGITDLILKSFQMPEKQLRYGGYTSEKNFLFYNVSTGNLYEIEPEKNISNLVLTSDILKSNKRRFIYKKDSIFYYVDIDDSTNLYVLENNTKTKISENEGALGFDDSNIYWSQKNGAIYTINDRNMSLLKQTSNWYQIIGSNSEYYYCNLIDKNSSTPLFNNRFDYYLLDKEFNIIYNKNDSEGGLGYLGYIPSYYNGSSHNNNFNSFIDNVQINVKSLIKKEFILSKTGSNNNYIISLGLLQNDNTIKNIKNITVNTYNLIFLYDYIFLNGMTYDSSVNNLKYYILINKLEEIAYQPKEVS